MERVLDFLLLLVGKRRIECPRCDGAGTTRKRGDWCWPCRGTGIQYIGRPHR